MEYLFVYILMCIQLLSSSVVSFFLIKFSLFFFFFNRFSLPVLFYIVCLVYPLFPICISERKPGVSLAFKKLACYQGFCIPVLGGKRLKRREFGSWFSS